VFVDFCFFVEGGFWEGSSCFDEYLFPPAHLFESGVIHVGGTVEGLNCLLSGFVVFALDHEVYLFEFVINLLEDSFVLVI